MLEAVCYFSSLMILLILDDQSCCLTQSCFSTNSVLFCCIRSSQKDCHLALPYYRMSGLSVIDVITRNRPLPSSPHSFGSGFLFYLKHYLLEETEQSLSQVHTHILLHRLIFCLCHAQACYDGRHLRPSIYSIASN